MELKLLCGRYAEKFEDIDDMRAKNFFERDVKRHKTLYRDVIRDAERCQKAAQGGDVTAKIIDLGPCQGSR